MEHKIQYLIFVSVKTDIQQASVQYIITSVVEALMENPDRR